MSPSLEPMQAGESAYEVKFPLRADLAGEVRQWARAHLLADPHGSGEFGDSYETTTLYLDTANLDVFQGNRSVGRSKYRIRRYGSADSVFLERKLKRDGIVRKWRTGVQLGELTHLMSDATQPEWPSDWYYRRIQTRAMGTVCQVRYDRIARFASTPLGSIRLTMDEHVAAIPQRRMHFSAAAPQPLTAVPIILELRYRREMPVLFKQLIERFRLEPRAESKYRLAVIALGLEAGIGREVVLADHTVQLACPAS